jgi:glutaredoxin
MNASARDAAANKVQVVLYGKAGCHLCEEAYEALRRVQARRDFDLTLIDIRTDPDIFAEYAESIPVVEISGKQFCKYRVDETRLIERLEEVN